MSQKTKRINFVNKKSKKLSFNLMKVILLENVRKVGSIGDVIDVKRGFARNFLISKKKALFASKENIKEVEFIKQELNKKDQEKKKEAKLIQEKIKNKVIEIKKLSTENKELYGSVKPTEISKILKEAENVEIDPSMIQPTKEIKSLGIFSVILSLHSEIQSQIKINVIAEDEN